MKKRAPCALALASLLAALTSTPLHARQGEGTGTEGALFLLLPVGAMGVSMGHAVTALDGPESVWWNPAGLSGLDGRRVMLLRGEDVAGESTALSFLLPRSNVGVLGVSYQLTDLGELEYRDGQGNFLGTIAFRNHLAVLSAAADVVPSLALGVNLKMIQQRVSCRGQCADAGVTSTTYALDVGAQWREALGLPLRLGGMVAHAGPRVQIVNEGQADPLPTRLRIGAAYDVVRHFVEEGDEVHGLLVLELEDRWRDPGSPATYVGVEVGAGTTQALAVRAGYVFGADLQVDGAGVGVALRYDRFELGLGKSLASSTLSGESEPVHLTLGVLF
jgi:hypothetical protein